MIEIVRPLQDTSCSASERKVAPHVWLRQTEADGQFVEIVLPPFELNALMEECERSFPAYAIQVLEVLARNDAAALEPDTQLTPELTKGLFNTQLLGTVLTQDQVCADNAVRMLPELQQAFGLAMRGGLRLTADPIPELG